MATSRPLGAVLTAILPAFVGDGALAVRAYGIRERMTPGFIHRPRGTDDWFALAAPDGIDLGGGVVAGESLTLWPPGLPQRYGRADRRWSHTWLHLRGRVVDAELRGAGLGFGVALPIAAARRLERCLVTLHDELTTNPRPDPVVLRDAAQVFLRQATRGARGEAPARLADARAFIEAGYAQRIRLADLARRAGCAPAHFCALYRRWYGVSPIEHLIRVRLAQARRLLEDHGMSVAEAASEVGYDDYRHFSRLFRRRMGVSPSAVGSWDRRPPAG